MSATTSLPPAGRAAAKAPIVEPLAATGADPSRASAHAPDACVRGLAELARAALGPAELLRAALPLFAARFESPCVEIELTSAAASLRESHVAPGADAAFWSPPVAAGLVEALADARPSIRLCRDAANQLRMARIAVPCLTVDGGTVGALSLIARCDDRAEALALAGELQALSTLLVHAVDSARRAAAPAEVSTRAANAKSAPLIGATPPAEPARDFAALPRAVSFATTRELCFALANQLKNKCGCERVGVARVVAGQVELAALSGLGEVPQDSPRVRAQQAALSECLDFGPRLVCQRGSVEGGDALKSSPHRLHRAWHELCHGASVASLRLDVAGGTPLLLALERRDATPFTAADLDAAERLVRPYVPVLGLLDRARESLLAHARRALREGVRAAFAPGRYVRKALVAASIAFAAWIAFGSMPYEIAMPAAVRSTASRRIAAPFEGILAEVTHRPGDPVAAGEPLARFATLELELEARRLGHEIEAARLAESRAFADGERGEAAIARARIDELAARRDSCADQIARATLRGPFDGWLLRGDLRERVGARIERGQELFEVAPGRDVEFELALPEARSAAIGTGVAARFSPFAQPEATERLEVTRLAPATELRSGRNVVLLAAIATAPQLALRPGMEGIAVVEAGQRPVWWVVSHRAIDWLRLHVWP